MGAPGLEGFSGVGGVSGLRLTGLGSWGVR